MPPIKHGMHWRKMSMARVCSHATVVWGLKLWMSSKPKQNLFRFHRYHEVMTLVGKAIHPVLSGTNGGGGTSGRECISSSMRSRSSRETRYSARTPKDFSSESRSP